MYSSSWSRGRERQVHVFQIRGSRKKLNSGNVFAKKAKNSSLVPDDPVVHPGLHERGDEPGAPLKGASAPGQGAQHALVGGDGLGHVGPVAVRHVLASVGHQDLHAHGDDGLEEGPDVLEKNFSSLLFLTL